MFKLCFYKLGLGRILKKRPSDFYFFLVFNKKAFGFKVHIPHFAFSIFFFLKNQHLLRCSWDMNSANRQMNNVFGVTSNPKIIFLLFLVFSKINGI